MSNYFNEIPNNTKESNKIEKIKTSLRKFKDIETFEKEAIKTIKTKKDLKRQLKQYSQKIENTFLINWLWPQGLADSSIDIIVDKIWGEIQNLINDASFSLTDWIKDKWGSLTGLISGNKISHSELEIRYFVDTVYSVGYSFQKNSNGDFEVIDEKGIIIHQSKIDLISINGGIIKGKKIENKKETLDDILLERSFTGRGDGIKNIQEMVEILDTIGINAENENELNSITPEKLTDAYLTYYSEKALVNKPNKNNFSEIEAFFKNKKVKKLNIPIEKITYIKLYSKGSFNNSLKKGETNNDVTVLQNVMKDFHELTKGTKNNLIDLGKQVSSKTGKIFENGIGGILEYMNGPEGLILAGAMIYLLFFSDYKKTAWLSLAGLASGNVLAKAIVEDKNSGILQLLAKKVQDWGEVDLKNRPKILEGIEDTGLIGINKSNEKLNTIGILSRKNLGEILNSSKINNKGNININFVELFNTNERTTLEKIWGGDKYKSEVEKLLTNFFNSSELDNFTKKTGIQENIKLLQTKYNGHPISFSLFTAKVFLFNLKINQNQNNTSTSQTQQNTPQKKQINTPNIKPINPLDIKLTSAEKKKYGKMLNGYNGQKPTKQALNVFIFRNNKTNIITKLEGLKGLNANNQTIINNLIKELQK